MDINQQIEANLRLQISILERKVELLQELATQRQGLSDSEIEQLSQQEPLKEGWTEFSEHETALAKCRRIMTENQAD